MVYLTTLLMCETWGEWCIKEYKETDLSLIEVLSGNLTRATEGINENLGLGGVSPKFESGTFQTGVRRVGIELTCSIPTLCCLQVTIFLLSA
jgi:hypothetical protein